MRGVPQLGDDQVSVAIGPPLGCGVPRRASSSPPQPGGPIRARWCPPAAANARARHPGWVAGRCARSTPAVGADGQASGRRTGGTRCSRSAVTRSASPVAADTAMPRMLAAAGTSAAATTMAGIWASASAWARWVRPATGRRLPSRASSPRQARSVTGPVSGSAGTCPVVASSATANAVQARVAGRHLAAENGQGQRPGWPGHAGVVRGGVQPVAGGPGVLGGQPDQANAGCVASVLGAMRTRWAVPSVPLVNAAAATVTAVEALCA
ncbi:MAG TPA: hypothetical protein VEO01_20215, partial [Pseudonocardiaceae bacterium]|nr:hypothetical protein [Pseudonocardiaceae bacterium]